LAGEIKIFIGWIYKKSKLQNSTLYGTENHG